MARRTDTKQQYSTAGQALTVLGNDGNLEPAAFEVLASHASQLHSSRLLCCQCNVPPIRLVADGSALPEVSHESRDSESEWKQTKAVNK
jgi:hypothetical protein